MNARLSKKKQLEIIGGGLVVGLIAAGGIGFAFSGASSEASLPQGPPSTGATVRATTTTTAVPAGGGVCTDPIQGLDEIQPGAQELDGTRSLLSSDFPNDYGGVFATSESGFAVAEVHHDPCLEHAATVGFAGYTVSFRLVHNTLDHLTNVNNSIASSVDELRSRGIKLVAEGLNTKINRVVVFAENADPKPAEHYFAQRYGTGVVSVTPSFTPTEDLVKRPVN